MTNNTPRRDLICAEEIKKLLPPDCAVRELSVERRVDSTNRRLMELAAAGGREGTALIALEQTAGRGRRGRDFFSPDGSGLYLSLLLRPRISSDELCVVTVAAAAAVCEAIEASADVKTGIKWVNDVFADGKKVCGILTEALFEPDSDTPSAIVLGCGLNVYPPKGGFPSEISSKAGYICEKEIPGLRNRLAGEIIMRFVRYLNLLPARDFLTVYRQRSLALDRYVQVLAPAGPVRALAQSVDDSGRLIVRYDSGETEALSSGEISILL